MKVGYIRVSTQEQNTVRQEVLMQALDVEQVFIDRMSGKNLARPELQKLLAFVRTGDCVIVESISRFARNTRDLLELIERLQSKQVQFVSKKEAIDTTTPTGKFMLTVFGAVQSWNGNTFSSARERASPLRKKTASIKAESRLYAQALTVYSCYGTAGRLPQ